MVQHISMEQASQEFLKEGNYIILDVRREEEYALGHIPNAINYPNEWIKDSLLTILPDLKQTVYVYCRSGFRSKLACQKLEKIGYSHIVECGGILDYRGPIEK